MIVVKRPREGRRPALRGWVGEEGAGEFMMGTEHPTSNTQHRTPNDRERSKHWMLSVGCWMFDVSRIAGEEEVSPASERFSF
jgi:hypothetical protein